MSENRSQFVIYQTEDGQTRLDVRYSSFPRSRVVMHT